MELETHIRIIWAHGCNIDRGDFATSDHLLPMAMAGCRSSPALWLRGVSPKALTHPVVPDIDRQDYVSFGDFESCRGPGAMRRLLGDGFLIPLFVDACKVVSLPPSPFTSQSISLVGLIFAGCLELRRRTNF